MKYTGRLCETSPGNEYCFKLRNGKYLDGLGGPDYSIAVLFNDDYNHLVLRKSVWVAREFSNSIIFQLESDGVKGDVCCVSYGSEYFNDKDNPIYVDLDADDIILIP